jgi:hypothetical protein
MLKPKFLGVVRQCFYPGTRVPFSYSLRLKAGCISNRVEDKLRSCEMRRISPVSPGPTFLEEERRGARVIRSSRAGSDEFCVVKA